MFLFCLCMMIRPYIVFLLLCLAAAACHGASVDSIPQDQREKLCNDTKAACADACHQSASTHCDTSTLIWGCNCPPNEESKMIGTKPVGTFPIPKKLCRMDLALCHSSCQHLGEHGNQAKICRLQCQGSFPCDTVKAPEYNGTTTMHDRNSNARINVSPAMRLQPSYLLPFAWIPVIMV
ncbi:hypothetical protein BJV82DRAFT_354049 [Fennellomyces sp. T-0311]|nr:hypothetical protein BJV82DRAFT_354049 [Fennellomyces sp. T-0311]